MLESRHLLKSELPFPDHVIEWHIQKGLIKTEKPIAKTAKGFICKRCGQDQQTFFAKYPCFICDKTCVYCRSCVMMGRVSECTPLLTWKDADLPKWPAVRMEWRGVLSEGQEKAASSIVEAIRKKEELLIWAVCGAGKTEILFQGIEFALTKGLRVCIATPRTDVVLELAPRLKNAIKGVEIAALYGGSPDRGMLSPLMISTTHQLLRYKEAFDVIIVDEVDAFPYCLDKKLQYAVKKAGKQQCTRIYLTATPSREMKRHVGSGRLKAVQIPARYHRSPLPEPEFAWCGNWKKRLERKNIPSAVKNWLFKHKELDQPVFLFVPSIQTLQSAVRLLKKEHFNTAGVHADDPDRNEKVKQFRSGAFDILVTTTILERGVTVKKAQVGVLGAESAVFTESALVQISGRAGRHPQFPTGAVCFFHFGKTVNMIAARRHIQQMNKMAKLENLID
ncbi:DEAD/DEAH box helicase [Bacillus sonorensis]|uniref:Late competence protein ComFA n=2 Tax=Bacillus sonorensis TaxID=119858 RepID=M5NZS0_9BACI|nr:MULTISPECIES: DEAD/DEAH box helicase [Bacillus]TWK80537.1 ComF operon protein 1 [Bacillus paralicheniformis]ASB87169.1 ComF operon protein [Bacillus sonorensis]EME73351.1 late competence protein ComFA [Bacillus sonorensis L12]MBG9914338.1 competence protein ComF [Bacillus sonorensis]MCF7616417.1 DEAD/DEAH box helicase [Bacillus sonorensis]